MVVQKRNFKIGEGIAFTNSFLADVKPIRLELLEQKIQLLVFENYQF
jgi:hypothetical protein